MALSNKPLLPQEKQKKSGQVTISIKELTDEVEKTANFVDQLEVLLQSILSPAPTSSDSPGCDKAQSVKLATEIDLLRDKQFMTNRKLSNILERIEL
jgi:hypothetical protein